MSAYGHRLILLIAGHGAGRGKRSAVRATGRHQAALLARDAGLA
ncbi:hypothetical protein [Streptomyces sp. NPDC002640]